MSLETKQGKIKTDLKSRGIKTGNWPLMLAWKKEATKQAKHF